MVAASQVTMCPRDPGTETALRCSRCDAPICPRCLVHTPVGARCRDCARIARSPIYTLSTAHYARAAVASIVGGIAMGLAWGLILLPVSFGIFSIFLGAGLGYVFTRLLDFATGRKRGTPVVIFASAGIVIAWATTLLLVPEIGLYGLVAVGIGIYFANQNLRNV